MRLYRASNKKYSKSLSGEGAKITGGRWNSVGTSIIYFSESEALCKLEIMVHISLDNIPDNYKMISFDVPDEVVIREINKDELPTKWNSIPIRKETQRIGDGFCKENKHLIFKVPSILVKYGSNYLINPNHSDFKLIKIAEIYNFEFDSRILGK